MFHPFDVLENGSGFQSFVNVKLFLGETFQFFDCFVGATEHVELEEWLWVHDVGLVKVREEPVADAVGKNTEMGVGDAEVADELRDGIFGKVAAVLFALNQYGRLAALHYGVVNLLAPLYPNVGGEFGYHFGGVEDVIPKHLNERQNQRGLGSLLSRRLTFPMLHSSSETPGAGPYFVDKIHVDLLLAAKSN